MNVNAEVLIKSMLINDKVADVVVDVKIVSDDKIIRKSLVTYKFKFDQFNGDWEIFNYK